MILYESILFIVLFAMAIAWPSAILRLGSLAQRLARPLFERPALIPVAAGTLAAAGTAIVLYAGPSLSPAVHDEFAYLLGAETFTSGRLTNPTPEAWESFETFHEIMRPSYQSKYPPGQSLWLALGLRFASLEIALVALAFALGTATTWALTSFLSPGESLVGGVLGALRFGAGTYWTESLWGGALPAVGGALLLGACARLLSLSSATSTRRPQIWGLLFGLGLSILALTRPYEGLAFALIPTLFLVVSAWRKKPQLWPSLALAILPLALALVFLGTYNAAVTGSMWRLPYAEHEAQYTLAPPFLFQEPAAKASELKFRHEVFGDYYRDWLAEEHRAQRGGDALASAWMRKLKTHFDFYLGLFGAGLALFGLTKRWRIFAWPLAAAGLLILASLAVAYALPHYLSPGLGVLLLLFASGLGELHRRGPRLRALAWLIGFAFVLIFAARIVQQLRSAPVWTEERTAVIDKLTEIPGADIVFVSYEPGHSIHREWVFNPAEFSLAPVLFARSRGAIEDARVSKLYAERRPWSLFVTRDDRVRLEPFHP